jgi:serine/threonine-protein kinase
MTLAAGTPIGKYVVRRKLAEGGMAEIYLAAALGPEGFEKDVVIKRVRPGLGGDPEFVRMFIAEARVASRLNHANLVHIFDFDKHEDTYYLAMEYVRGHSLWELRRRCQERGVAIPPMLVAQIGMEIARGLAYAHRLSENGQSLNLVHRDVTPHNVLLSFDGAVKLTDFGIAKAGSHATTSGMLKGKFAYMSPEQARGEVVDARTDVFALGITLWELLTGARLFEGEGDVAVLRAVQERLIVPPVRLNPSVSSALDAAVMHALERDLGRRWPGAHELERALAEVVLAGARSLEDTDVGGFLRRMFPEEAGVAEPGPDVGSIPISLSGSAEPPGGGEDRPADDGLRWPPTQVLPPPGSEPGTTEVLPGAGRPRRRWGFRILALAVVAGAVVLALRSPLPGSGRGEPPAASPVDAPRLERAAEPPPAPASAVVATASPPVPAGTLPESPPVPPAAAASETAGGAGEPEAASAGRGGEKIPATVRAPLVIRAKPWAELRVDGKRSGYVQGTRTVLLPPGRHVIELTGPDRVPGLYTVQLVKGRTQKLEHPPAER